MNTLDMDLNVDMMNIDDIELMEFKPYFKGDCSIAGDNSQFCGEFCLIVIKLNTKC